MTGLYTAVFGEASNAATLVSWLNLTESDFARFRDAYKTMFGEIAVYTRLGGGNRYSYQGHIDAIRKHPNFLRDEDDTYDCTYLTFYFRCPPEHAEAFAEMASEQDRNSMWIDALARIDTMSEAEVQALGWRVAQHVEVIGGIC